ncbi:MAG: hypothetical protein ACXV8H_11955, partial [Chthoniobacterales bacterium]
KPVLLLLRGDFRDSERALNLLKKAGVPVAVSLKETGSHQIAKQLADPARLRRFLRLIANAHGYIAPTPEAAEFYRTIRGDPKLVAFIPTPYPLHDARWNFARPNEQKRGILVGTREWDVPSRNHLAALLAARRISEATDEPVTVYDFDGRTGGALLNEIGFRANQLRVLTRESSYVDYLRVVAEHKIVFQLDRSSVPGQVAGDALLARVLCIGGNGAIDCIAFPELSGARPVSELIELSIALLRANAAYEKVISESQRRAAEQLSFERVAAQLKTFYTDIASK